MKKKYLIGIFLALSVLSSAQEVLSLEEAVQKAIDNNYNIKIASNSIERAKKQYNIGNADMLPTLGVSGSTSKTFGSTKRTVNELTTDIDKDESNSRYSIRGDQKLFDGLAMFKTYERFGKAVELQSLSKQQRKET